MTSRFVRLRVVLAFALVGLLLLPALPVAAQNVKPFGDLPASDYPCPNGSSTRTTLEAKSIAAGALDTAEIAEGVAEVALAAVRHAALQTVVAAGEGGNVSLTAEPFDIAKGGAIAAKFLAKTTLDVMDFADDCIDSAEIEGSYKRLGVLGDWTNQLATKQLEEYLSRGVVLTSLFLPEEFGGQLEVVRDLVQISIQNMNKAGFDVRYAQKHYEHALAQFNAQQYPAAYGFFVAAYKKLLQAN